MLPEEVRKEIENKFGQPIRYPKDCLALSEAIYLACRRRISESTLKRLLGFVHGIKAPRLYTLDILANYLGHPDYKSLQNLHEIPGNSEFQIPFCISSDQLQSGAVLVFCYAPNRELMIKYLGDGTFEVCSSLNSGLRDGDIFKASHFFEDYPLYLSEVIRENVSLGPFTAGKSGGIKKLRIIQHAT